MGSTGYQPVPLGNLPNEMEERICGQTKARLLEGAFPLPPGW